MQISGRFVGNGLDRSVRFSRYIVISGRLQRAAYMPPLRMTRYIHYNPRSRAGHAPPLPRNVFYCPVGRGDPTPPRKWATAAIFPLISRLSRQLPPAGEAIHAVYPSGLHCRKTAGGACPAPTPHYTKKCVRASGHTISKLYTLNSALSFLTAAGWQRWRQTSTRSRSARWGSASGARSASLPAR